MAFDFLPEFSVANKRNGTSPKRYLCETRKVSSFETIKLRNCLPLTLCPRNFVPWHSQEDFARIKLSLTSLLKRAETRNDRASASISNRAFLQINLRLSYRLEQWLNFMDLWGAYQISRYLLEGFYLFRK